MEVDMGQGAAPSDERRRDPRVAPAGRVRVAPLSPPSVLEGRLVDVSAGGLRVAGELTMLEEGARVRLEIRLDDPSQPGGPPRLVLDGTGAVVWSRPLDPEAMMESGVRFDAPLEVRRPFPEVQVF
jgi:hypothetical protein